MAIIVTLETKELNARLSELANISSEWEMKASSELAEEILRLSQFEVPHDTGQLQNTGATEPEPGGYIVGYNKVYAARLHEHPEYNFQKGRKGKYLEDPIKNNMHVFLEFVGNIIKSSL